MKNCPRPPAKGFSRTRRTALSASALLLLFACAAPTLATSLPLEYSSLPAVPPSPQGDQAAFSDYAWRLFVALNWPAQPGVRGVPDRRAPFGAPGLTVWQSFKTSGQLFLPNAQDPGPWNSGAIVAPFLRFHSKAPSELPLPPSIRQAVGGWLIDTQSNPTYYEIAVNQLSYDYVRSNRYYDASVLNQATSVQFPDGALEIKASWRIMQGVDPTRYRTLVTQVMTFDASGQPTGRYETKTVGLVGLHIVYKPAGFPQWIWATFEQRDNAPDDASAPGTTAKWSYYNPACSGPYCTPNVSPLASGQPFGTPNQVTRLSPIRPATAVSNTKWQALLRGTAFANYELISPQWPSDPNDPGNPQGTPTPGTVANTTMESYIQPTSSCMDCHSTARVPNGNIKSNYSFLFLFAQSPSSPTPQP